MRRHRFLAPTLAVADHLHDGKSGDTGIDVHDSATSEIESPHLEQPAVWREDPVSNRCVDQQKPSRDEHGVGAELQSISGGTRDECGGNHCEHHLVRNKRDRRDDEREVDDVVDLDVPRNLRCCSAQSFQPDEVEVSDEAVLSAEGEAEPDQCPQDADHADGKEVLHQHAEDMFGTDHAAIEEREAGGHEEHECGRNEHPGSRPGVDVGEQHSCCSRRRDHGVVADPGDGPNRRRSCSINPISSMCALCFVFMSKCFQLVNTPTPRAKHRFSARETRIRAHDRSKTAPTRGRVPVMRGHDGRIRPSDRQTLGSSW